LPFFGQNCSLPFSLRSLDIPALLKSWKKQKALKWLYKAPGYQVRSKKDPGAKNLTSLNKKKLRVRFVKYKCDDSAPVIRKFYRKCRHANCDWLSNDANLLET
jgi:hypothetical protein